MEPTWVSMVDISSNGYHCHQGTSTSVWCDLCVELHCRDATGFKTDVDSVPLTEYTEQPLAKLKLCNAWHWFLALSGVVSKTTGPGVLKEMVNILFLERKPVLEDRRAWFIFGQPHHVTTFKKEIQNLLSATSSGNLLGPFGSNTCDCPPLFLLFCCQLVGNPSCTPLLLIDDSMCNLEG